MRYYFPNFLSSYYTLYFDMTIPSNFYKHLGLFLNIKNILKVYVNMLILLFKSILTSGVMLYHDSILKNLFFNHYDFY
jgi:hypothetical protein